MNVGLTGASGFIGRHVLAELERRGVSPVLLTRRMPEAATPARHRTERMDLHDPSGALRAVADLDVLIHLAWGGLPHYRSPHHVLDEAPAHFQFLRRVFEAGVKNVLVTGTCYEYGMQSGSLHEEMDARPVTAYGLGKDLLRRQVEFLAGHAGRGWTWTRLFYPFGDGQAATSLLPQLARAVADGATEFDMSPGEQLRDFIPVEQVARHLVALALGGRGFGVVNVCSGQPTSVRTMVERWIEQNGWTIRLNLGRYAYPEYEPLAFWGNPDKLHRCLAALGAR